LIAKLNTFLRDLRRLTRPYRYSEERWQARGLLALIYAVVGTWLAHIIGRPLAPLNFEKQKVEANFRFSLVRFRKNAEGIALHHGEAGEQLPHTTVISIGHRHTLIPWHDRCIELHRENGQGQLVTV
jgi:ABC-type uncharacterized transport system fused permease/ATPase subunit